MKKIGILTSAAVLFLVGATIIGQHIALQGETEEKTTAVVVQEEPVGQDDTNTKENVQGEPALHYESEALDGEKGNVTVIRQER